jgi:hypothetical protein
MAASGDTHPAWMLGHAAAGDYLVVGASAIGKIHLAHSARRDDAFLVRTNGDWLTVAVADGVGSRPLSRYGATYVVENLTASILRPLSLSLKAPDESKVRESTGVAAQSPPAAIEEVELTFGAKKGGGAEALAQVLAGWDRTTIAEESWPETKISQAASVGWRLSEPRMQHENPVEQILPQEPNSTDLPDTVDEYLNDTDQPVPNLTAIMQDAFRNTHLGLCDHASRLGLTLSDLGCTALALLLNVDTGVGAVAQIGDGAILGLTTQGQTLELVEPPDTGDPQSTYTLNKPNFEAHLAISSITASEEDPFVAFFVMTDGLAGDLLYSAKPDALRDWAQKVDRNLRNSASPMQAAAGMLNWLANYVVPGSWDDRTLVVITQQERNDGDCQSGSEQPEPAQPTDAA